MKCTVEVFTLDRAYIDQIGYMVIDKDEVFIKHFCNKTDEENLKYFESIEKATNAISKIPKTNIQNYLFKIVPSS